MKQIPKRQKAQYVTEQDVLRRHHKFLRDSDSESSDGEQERSARKNKEKNSVYQKYGQQMAKKYYSKLFKQYALVDLSRYESGQIGCRWRTEKQVMQEKGQNYCGSVHCHKLAQQVYEMNFGYKQDGEKKNALVKVSVCRLCGVKLNYKKSLKKIVNESKQKIEQVPES